jgi:hypothetical protein
MKNLLKGRKKNVVPQKPNIKIAYYGFNCPICGAYVPAGTNYLDYNGFKVCVKEYS